jgi:hypothetical protein
MTEFKDSMGQLLKEGDFVAFKEDWYNGFNFGRIEKFTPKMVKVIGVGRKDTIKDPSHLLKIEGPYVDAWMAERGQV